MREGAYKNYLLALLVLVYAATFLERSALNLLLQDIKVDLSLTDTQLGLLTGIAFALFYAVMGIPIARWADRGNRVMIIAIALALQGAAMFLSGLAGSFLQLMLVRILVAVGEAGCIPATHSLLASYFTRAVRPRAFAIYCLGAPLSALIGSFAAGWLNEIYGWRVTFMLLGLPCLTLGALAWFTMREPRRGKSTMDAATTLAPSLKDVWLALWAITTFRHLLIGYSVVYFFIIGIWKWQPAFFIRSHGLQTGELGVWFATIYGVGGLLGTYLGGEWASRRAAGNERLQLKGIAVMYSSFGVISVGTYLTPNPYVAFGLMAFATLGVYAAGGPLFAAIQTLVAEPMRATAIAIIYFFANLIGLGLGPIAAGVMSDALRPLVGEESLRYALLALCPGYVWAGWHFWRASRTVTHDVEAAQGNRDARVQMEEGTC